MKIATSTATWGQFRKQNPDEWPQERVLREAKDAGFDAVMSGVKPGQTPEELLEFLSGFGLVPAPGYYGADFWIPEEREAQVERARQMARNSRALGLTELFVSPTGWRYVSRASGKERNQLAGHVGPDDGLSDDEWRELAITLNAMGAATQEEGVFICVHNHAAQVIETRAECDRLFNSIDPNLVFWGPDTAHLTYGGADAVAFFRDYASQIKSIHLKDVVPGVLEEARKQKWDYATATAHGLWTELGQGCIDHPAIFAILREAGYDGWIISEIDETRKPSALQSARECREFLRSQGL